MSFLHKLNIFVMSGNGARYNHTNTRNMTIKGADGQSYNVTSQGQGTFNSVGAGAGIASFLGLNAGTLLGGCANPYARMGAPVEVITSDDKPVSRYEAGMMDQLAKKDAEIALLKADKYTDEKIVETTRYLDGKIEALADEVHKNKEEQSKINMEQATYNGVNTATLQCMKGQIAALLGLTKLVVPNSSVCPGWGNVTITPAASTTTGGGAA